MAGTRICPNCGAQNPSANRFCEDCGYDMNKVSAPSKELSRTLCCPNGHTVSKPGLGFCDVCGEKLIDERSSLESQHYDQESSPQLDPYAVNVKLCPSCGAVNSEDGLFCEVCGVPLTGPKPVPELACASKQIPVVQRLLPEIPDIMRPLTNDDMKR